MTTDAFISELCSTFGCDPDDGLSQGWIDTEDILLASSEITRKNAARIIHMYLLKVCGISDLPMTGASVLRDLYDCRVCANHVAQVYLRGIMEARDLKKNGGFLWFDLDGEDVDRGCIRRAFEVANGGSVKRI